MNALLDILRTPSLTGMLFAMIALTTLGAVIIYRRRKKTTRKSSLSFLGGVRRALSKKNRGAVRKTNSGTLLKILETPDSNVTNSEVAIQKIAQKNTAGKGRGSSGVLSKVLGRKTILPPPPINKVMKRTSGQTQSAVQSLSGSETISVDGLATQGAAKAVVNAAADVDLAATRKQGNLERIVVQMFQEYLNGISEFQNHLSKASTETEIIHRACKSFSKLTRDSRVVYLEYQNTQRAVMVTARSEAKIFAGTQPRMFLPLRAGVNTSRARIEDLRDCFNTLPSDRELQRLLQDACLLEAPTDGEISQELLWSSRTPWVIFPVVLRGVPQGFFAMQKHSVCERNEFNDVMNIYLSSATTAIENIRLHSRMGEINSRDNVTGLLTRKLFQERLQENFLIARRLRHPLTLLRLDVQHMESYSKRYGSNVRDAILRHVSKQLQRFFRQSDIMARFSDKGFAIIMPHTTLIDAMKKSEDLVCALSDSSLRLGTGEAEFEIRVDACAGLAEFPSHTDNPSDLVRFANEAVFRGMNKDRSAVTMAKVPMGYVPPFNSRFIRSSPKSLQESGVGPILDS